MSQGQPAPLSRSAAMISIKRRMSREDVTGAGPSPPGRWRTKEARLASRASTPPDAERGPISNRERNGLAALRRVDHAHIDLLAFRKARDPRPAEDGNVDEDVLAPVIARDEAESLGVVEPLD